MATVRKNITMSDEISDWYANKADSLGVSQSGLMTIALSEYMKQDKAMIVMANLETIIKQVQELNVLPGSKSNSR